MSSSGCTCRGVREPKSSFFNTTIKFLPKAPELQEQEAGCGLEAIHARDCQARLGLSTCAGQLRPGSGSLQSGGLVKDPRKRRAQLVCGPACLPRSARRNLVIDVQSSKSLASWRCRRTSLRLHERERESKLKRWAAARMAAFHRSRRCGRGVWASSTSPKSWPSGSTSLGRRL